MTGNRCEQNVLLICLGRDHNREYHSTFNRIQLKKVFFVKIGWVNHDDYTCNV